jgi:hypothetical protein
MGNLLRPLDSRPNHGRAMAETGNARTVAIPLDAPRNPDMCGSLAHGRSSVERTQRNATTRQNGTPSSERRMERGILLNDDSAIDFSSCSN